MDTEQDNITFANIVDMDRETFEDFCSKHNLGFLCNLNIFIQNYYIQLSDVKERILSLAPEMYCKEDIEKIYGVLQILENKYLYIDTLIKKGLEEAGR